MPELVGTTEFEVEVGGSRFFAIAWPAADEAEVRREMRRRRKKLRKACHHCWALRRLRDEGPPLERLHNDGEVGRPGNVMLELLRGRELEGAILVSRIFGGVKLGPGGVARAFRRAARGALGDADD